MVFDGAMGTSLQRLELGATQYGAAHLVGCNEYLVLSYPAAIEGVHRSFLEVGVDVVETCTFQGSRLKLAEWGLADQAATINRTAAALARGLADEYATPDHPRFVAGSLGPTGMLPSSSDPTLSEITFDELAEVYAEQAAALIAGGADLLIVETMQDILELKAVIAGCGRLFRQLGQRVPIQAQVTLDTGGRMLLGTDIAATLATLEALPVDVIGLNCGTGPEHMREPVRYLAEHSRLPVSVIPNAGIPLNEGGVAVYPAQPEAMAEELAGFVGELGVEIVGGCCGTTPAHLARIVERVSALSRRRREPDHVPSLSSGVRAVALRQDPAPLLVGERVNAQGSRVVKRKLLAEDWDGVLQVGREQVDGGAHALDVCVALTERADEPQMIRQVVRTLAMGVEAPLVIDSTEYRAVEEGLAAYPGRALVNSVNLESGRERVERVLPMVREHGAAVVALTIDEQGMAKTAERKLAVAQRIHDIACQEFGLRPEDLVFDALTFTLATGEQEFRNSAVEALEGIGRIKAALPGVHTILGVSNVSFGLSGYGRAVLNSVFLYHAVQAGLDLAIVNPAHVRPYAEVPADERQVAEALIFNRADDALARFIAFFGDRGALEQAEGEQEDALAGMTVEERIHYQILHRRKDGVEALLDQALERHTPVEVLNTVLLPAMKDVGDRFGAGELILPFVLQSAEVMKKAVAHLEQYLERREGYTKGRVVLATVYGDVHDIGKNLVNTILTNNGYTVYDLGKQVPVNVIIDKAIEVEADAIGLSALLVSTSKQMPLCVQELDHRGLRLPVLIGGAAINRAYGYRTLYLEDGRPYPAGVFYCRDAFDGLETMDRLSDEAQRETVVQELLASAEGHRRSGTPGRSAAETPGASAAARSSVRADVPVPKPPFWGTRVLDRIDLREVFACLDLNTLFRLHWGGKVHGEEFERLVREEFRPRLARLEEQAVREGWLQPRAVYGYFRCYAEGNDLVVLSDDTSIADERARFRLPRRPDRDRVSLADYWRPKESGELDVVAFQIVTVGGGASELVERLQAAGEYADMLFVHGLSVQTAEATAEYVHRQIRRELGLAPDQGRRYSWGYPACPDLEQHRLVLDLLPQAAALDVSLTAAWQWVPEQTTAAVVAHHPEAKYFSTRPREDGEAQREFP